MGSMEGEVASLVIAALTRREGTRIRIASRKTQRCDQNVFGSALIGRVVCYNSKDRYRVPRHEVHPTPPDQLRTDPVSPGSRVPRMSLKTSVCLTSSSVNLNTKKLGSKNTSTFKLVKYERQGFWDFNSLDGTTRSSSHATDNMSSTIINIMHQTSKPADQYRTALYRRDVSESESCNVGAGMFRMWYYSAASVIRTTSSSHL